MAKRECPGCGLPVTVNKDGTLRAHGPVNSRCDQQPSVLPRVGDCEACGGLVELDEDGVIPLHNDKQGRTCPGSPADTPLPESPGPAPFGAVSEAPATVASMDDAKPDPFESPATVERETPEPETNVSGQPEPLRDQWRRYLLPNPATGLYSDGKAKATRRNGWTRATTFAKAAADTFSLTRYDERLTLVGATLRPDVVALAHGKRVREDAKELNQLVLQVKDAAGAKVAANIGTAVHSFTEQLDARLASVEDTPVAYRQHVQAYQEALHEAGLEPVPGLIERTTFVDRWGGISGTFDRVLYHRPSNTYLIGDLKTGRDLSYGRMEIAVQLALYAHGINAWGVFDWGTGAWDEPHTPESVYHRLQVRMDYGVVMHLPIQGDAAGTCTLKRINLAAGWAAAHVCGDVIFSRKRADYMEDGLELPDAPYVPETPPQPVSAPLPPVDWEPLFRAVPHKDAASRLWQEAKAAGVDRMERDRLVDLAQQRLRELGVSG
jgi:hypothetical protein